MKYTPEIEEIFLKKSHEFDHLILVCFVESLTGYSHKLRNRVMPIPVRHQFLSFLSIGAGLTNTL